VLASRPEAVAGAHHSPPPPEETRELIAPGKER
jgi:hypothetical protein